jgi:hypothetical protein
MSWWTCALAWAGKAFFVPDGAHGPKGKSYASVARASASNRRLRVKVFPNAYSGFTGFRAARIDAAQIAERVMTGLAGHVRGAAPRESLGPRIYPGTWLGKALGAFVQARKRLIYSLDSA